MANPVSTFVELFVQTPDPYVPRGTVLTGFATGANARTPAQIWGDCTSDQYPMVLLMAGADSRPVVATAPFAEQQLPGIAAAQRKFAFMGDILPQGQLPGLVEITNECFHQTQPTAVLERADVMAAFNALPAAADDLLPIPAAPAVPAVAGQAAPAVNVRNVVMCRAMPVPHEYVPGILARYNEGTLNWRWLWANPVADALADPAKEGDYELFLNFVLVSCTRRPGAQAGQPDRNPASEMDHNGMAPPRARAQALTVARHFLPGLRQAIGVNQQIQQVATNQQQIVMQLAQGRDRRKTLQRDKPGIYETALKICEVPMEADVAPYWAGHANLTASEWVGSMNQTARSLAMGRMPTLICPIIPPAMAQDIAGGNVTSASADPGRGISPFLITLENYSAAGQQVDQNRVYTAALMGTGPVGDQALEMVLDTSKYTIPKTIKEFRGTMEGFYVTLMIFCGAHNRAVQNFYTNVISQLGHLITILNARYLPAQHPPILLKIQAYVHLMINDYLSQLLAADVPTVLNVPAAGAPATAPNFSRIQERFAEGTIQDLTAIPAALVSSVNPRAPAPPPTNAGVPSQAGGTGGAQGRGGGNAQVKRRIKTRECERHGRLRATKPSLRRAPLFMILVQAMDERL